jgi:arsenic resistance protein ArsH
MTKMKIMIFNGALEKRTLSTSSVITSFLTDSIGEKGGEVTIFNLAEAGIPFLDVTLKEPPRSVSVMANTFKAADAHIWLTPLYHGGMTGAMKNCLDWLEVTAKDPVPYLTDKVIGLVCWADGGKAMLGIQAMDSVAKSLRAWVHPYSVPIVKCDLYQLEYTCISPDYQKRLSKMTDLMIKH